MHVAKDQRLWFEGLLGSVKWGHLVKRRTPPRLPAWGLERAFRKICWGLPPVEFLKSKKQRAMMSLSYQGDWGGLFPPGRGGGGGHLRMRTTAFMGFGRSRGRRRDVKVVALLLLSGRSMLVR